MPQIIRQFLANATAKGARSTALQVTIEAKNCRGAEMTKVCFDLHPMVSLDHVRTWPFSVRYCKTRQKIRRSRMLSLFLMLYAVQILYAKST